MIGIARLAAAACLIAMPALALPVGPIGANGDIPPLALASGYTALTFDTDQNFNTSTVDTAQTYASGFQWYCNNQYATWNCSAPNPDGSQVLTLQNGQITFLGGGVRNSQLMSAGKSGVFGETIAAPGSGFSASDTVSFSNGAVLVVDTVDGSGAILTFHVQAQPTTPVAATLSQTATSGAGVGAQFAFTIGMVGEVFGCGAYFEFTASFDPYGLSNTGAGVPATWLATWEAFQATTPRLDQWQGQVDGFQHYTEQDVMEMNTVSTFYHWNLIDWWGNGGGACAPGGQTGQCAYRLTYSFTPPAGTQFTTFHRYAALWIPATPSTPGSWQFLFDDVPDSPIILHDYYDPASSPAPVLTQNVVVNGVASAPPPYYAPSGPSWLEGVADSQHYLLILGDGSLTNPMTVSRVRVFQNPSTECNITG